MESEFLVDALQTMNGRRAVFDVKQDTLSSNGEACHCPPLIVGYRATG